jgi:hypothetical protein
VIPALFTATSSWPNLSSANATDFSTDLGSPTSCWNATAMPPSFSIPEATLLAAFSLMSATTTVAPYCAIRRAIASPIPDPAPVTIATLFSNNFVIFLFLLVCVNG